MTAEKREYKCKYNLYKYIDKKEGVVRTLEFSKVTENTVKVGDSFAEERGASAESKEVIHQTLLEELGTMRAIYWSHPIGDSKESRIVTPYSFQVWKKMPKDSEGKRRMVGVYRRGKKAYICIKEHKGWRKAMTFSAIKGPKASNQEITSNKPIPVARDMLTNFIPAVMGHTIDKSWSKQIETDSEGNPIALWNSPPDLFCVDVRHEFDLTQMEPGMHPILGKHGKNLWIAMWGKCSDDKSGLKCSFTLPEMADIQQIPVEQRTRYYRITHDAFISLLALRRTTVSSELTGEKHHVFYHLLDHAIVGDKDIPIQRRVYQSEFSKFGVTAYIMLAQQEFAPNRIPKKILQELVDEHGSYVNVPRERLADGMVISQNEDNFRVWISTLKGLSVPLLVTFHKKCQFSSDLLDRPTELYHTGQRYCKNAVKDGILQTDSYPIAKGPKRNWKKTWKMRLNPERKTAQLAKRTEAPPPELTLGGRTLLQSIFNWHLEKGNKIAVENPEKLKAGIAHVIKRDGAEWVRTAYERSNNWDQFWKVELPLMRKQKAEAEADQKSEKRPTTAPISEEQRQKNIEKSRKIVEALMQGTIQNPPKDEDNPPKSCTNN